MADDKKQKKWANQLRSNLLKKGRALALTAATLGGGASMPTPPSEDTSTVQQTQTAESQTETEESQTETEEEAKEREELEKMKKSGITQGINSLRYSKQIKEIETKEESARQNTVQLYKDLKKEERLLKPLERKRKNLKLAIRATGLLKWGLYLIGIFFAITIIFFFLIPVSQMFFALGRIVGGVQTGMKKLVEGLEEKIKPIKEEMEKVQKKITENKKIIQALAQEKYRIQNQSLLSRGAPAT